MRVWPSSLGLFTIIFSFSVWGAPRSDLERLEKGEIISQAPGSSFYIHTFLEPARALAIKQIKSNPRKLADLFPNIAFVEPMRSSDGHHLLYLKLRGLGEEGGVIVSVIGMSDEAFEGAPVLDVPATKLSSLSDLKSDPNSAPGLEVAMIQTEALLKEQETKVSHKIEPETTIRIRGPLNDQIQQPGLKLDITLSIGTYTKDLSTKGYLFTKVNFDLKTPKSELFDWSFKDRNISIARNIGVKLVRKLVN